MIRIYMVEINKGFGGVKYFQEEINAKNYAYKIGEKVEPVTVTTHEWHNIDYSDPIL